MTNRTHTNRFHPPATTDLTFKLDMATMNTEKWCWSILSFIHQKKEKLWKRSLWHRGHWPYTLHCKAQITTARPPYPEVHTLFFVVAMSLVCRSSIFSQLVIWLAIVAFNMAIDTLSLFNIVHFRNTEPFNIYVYNLKSGPCRRLASLLEQKRESKITLNTPHTTSDLAR